MPRLRVIFAVFRRVGGWSLAIVPTVLVLLAVAFYLLLVPRLDGLRPYVTQSLSHALRAPVRMEGMHLGWDWGPSLELAALRVGTPAHPELVLQGVHLRLFALPLLWGRLVARDFRVARGEVSVTPAAEGGWRVAGQTLGRAKVALPLNLDWAQVDVRHFVLQWRSQPHATPVPLHVRWQSSGGLRPHMRARLRWSPQGVLRYTGAVRGIFTAPGRSSGSGHWVAQGLPLAWLHRVDPRLPALKGSLDSHGRLQWWYGLPRVAVGRFTMHAPELDGARWTQLQGRLDWRGTGSSGILRLADVRGVAARPLAVSLGLNWGQRLRWQIRSPRLPAVLLRSLPAQALPERLRWIPGQTWRGTLRNLHFRWRSAGNQPAVWRLQTRLQGIGVSPHGPWLGMRGLSGDLVLRPDDLRLHLASPRLILDWPQRFAAPLNLQGVSAQIHAQKIGADWSLQANQISLQGPDHVRATLAVRGRQMRLQAQLAGMPATTLADFVPQTGIKPALRHWLLQAFQAGTLHRAQLDWRGSWQHLPRDVPGEHFSLDADFRGVTLRYAPRWPVATRVNAQLLWTGRRLSVRSREGDILGVPVASASAEIDAPFAQHTSPLQVKLETPVPLDKLLPFLRKTPVLRGKAMAKAPLRLSGQGQLHLALSIPLGGEKTQVTGNLVLNRAGIGWNAWQATNVRGPLHFQRDEIRASTLKGVFAGGPLQVSLQAGHLETQPRLAVALQGDVQAAELPVAERWRAALSGMAPYQGSATLWNGVLHFEANADLRHVHSALPAPLGWAPGQSVNLNVQGQGDLAHSLQVDFRLPPGSGVLAWRREGSAWRWQAGAVRLGGGVPPPLPRNGFTIQGSGNTLPMARWLTLLKGDHQGPGAWPDIRFDLRWQHLLFLAQNWPDVRMHGMLAARKLHMRLTSPQLAGVLRYQRAMSPENPARLRLDIQKLRIAAPSPGVSSAPVLSQVLGGAGGDPLILGTRVAQLDWHGHQVHDVLLEGVRSATGWDFPTLKGDWAGSRWHLKGTWQGAGAGRSTFQGSVRSRNIAPALHDIGMDSLEYGRADYRGVLSWPGAPWDFSPRHLGGRVQSTLWRGRLGKLGTDISWLVFLNPTTLLEDLLTFDYRPLFGSGLFFSKLSADVQFRDGLAHTRDLLLQSSALEMRGSGDANLVDRTLNMALRVYPLQSMDLLLGHFPVLGRVFFGKSGKVLELNYRVEGSWKHPMVRQVSLPAGTGEG